LTHLLKRVLFICTGITGDLNRKSTTGQVER